MLQSAISEQTEYYDWLLNNKKYSPVYKGSITIAFSF